MKKLFHNTTFKSRLSIFLLAVAIICAYKIIMEADIILGWGKTFVNIISPFLAGFCLAYLLNIPRNKIRSLLEKSPKKFLKNTSRGLSVLITCLLFLLLIYFALRLVIPSIYRSIYDFFSNMPAYIKNLQTYAEQINELELFSDDINLNELISSSVLNNIKVEDVISSLGAVFGVSSAIFSGFLAFVSSIYIMLEGEKFKKFAARLLNVFLSSKACTIFLKYTSDLNTYFKQYIFCQTIDGCILGTVATIELMALGSDYALTLGIMLGIMNFVPYFGSIIGSVIAVIIIIFTESLAKGLAAAVLLIVTQQLDGNLLQPRLMGGSFDISPLLIIVSITIGGAVGGALGMIVAIPIVAVLKNILEDFITYQEKRKAELS